MRNEWKEDRGMLGRGEDRGARRMDKRKLRRDIDRWGSRRKSERVSE